jgi:hypothetical protein
VTPLGVSGIIAQLDGPASKMLEEGMNLFNQNYNQKSLDGDKDKDTNGDLGVENSTFSALNDILLASGMSNQGLSQLMSAGGLSDGLAQIMSVGENINNISVMAADMKKGLATEFIERYLLLYISMYICGYKTYVHVFIGIYAYLHIQTDLSIHLHIYIYICIHK